MRSLTSIRDLSKLDIIELLDSANSFADKIDAGSRHHDALSGMMITNAFFEPSTRTRMSFDMAARCLGAEVLNFDPVGSSTVKGESLEDTARTLAAIGTDLFVVRSEREDGPAMVARATGRPVVSGGAGRTEHPTQTLLDLLTMRRHFGHIENLRVGIVGDIANSRVAAGLMYALPLLGAQFRLAGPPSLLPDRTSPVDLDDLLPEVDIAYFLRVQEERGAQTGLPSHEAYMAAYGMTGPRLKALPRHAVVMHPGPMNRGVEIADEVADHARCLVTTQVALGVPTRMAVLNRCLDHR